MFVLLLLFWVDIELCCLFCVFWLVLLVCLWLWVCEFWLCLCALFTFGVYCFIVCLWFLLIVVYVGCYCYFIVVAFAFG